jgi:uncharacterized protein (TIGR00661 family)
MSTIFYGLSGEGRGHATRARTVVESLKRRHRVVVFAPDLAYELLEPTYRGTGVDVHRIPGLQFAYNQQGRVALLGTLAEAAKYRYHSAARVRDLGPVFERERPDLVIADFEPLLPRAARTFGVPFMSLDHQHYLVVNDLSFLPAGLRHQARMAAPFVKALYDWQVETVVSSFYAPPLRRGVTNVTQIGVLLRPELLAARPRRDGYLLVYMRRFAPPELLNALAVCGMPVRFYGVGERPREGHIEFKSFDERGFMDDLIGCEAVVSTAGNQLVGEALYLRKPVLAMPEHRNFEQAINGHFLEASGGGRVVPGKMDTDTLLDFMEDIEVFRRRIVPDDVCGNFAAVRAIERHLRPGTDVREHEAAAARRSLPGRERLVAAAS